MQGGSDTWLFTYSFNKHLPVSGLDLRQMGLLLASTLVCMVCLPSPTVTLNLSPFLSAK